VIGVTILGATGTIGLNTLDVLTRHADRYRIVALTAHRDIERMIELCLRYRPQYAVMADEEAAQRLHERLRRDGLEVEVLGGTAGLEAVAALPQVDYVMAAIVGAAGLLPVLAAVRAAKRILLANKEALVMAGGIFMDAVRESGAELLPIDSEHNAVFQCMPNEFRRGLDSVGVRRIVLTSSGGPFRSLPASELVHVTPQQACAHPNWVMGRKISVDSATMMNKGLEVIEACWLFAASPEKVEVVVHPQSVIHSLVEYVDGSMLAQLGTPDMRIPIAYALAWPQRLESGAESLSLSQIGRLEFEAPDVGRFPCLGFAYRAAERGGTAPTIMNAANEIAVEAFLGGALQFTEIAAVIEATMGELAPRQVRDLDSVLTADAQARVTAGEIVARIGGGLGR